VGHHRSVSYSVELVPLNKHQIYGGAPKVNCYTLGHWCRSIGHIGTKHIVPAVSV